MQKTRSIAVVLGCFALYPLMAATKPAIQPNDSTLDSPTGMRASIERYMADRSSLMRAYSIELSTARRDRMQQLYAEWLDRLAKVDFNSLSQAGRIDYLLFQNHLQHELRQLDLTAKNQAEAASLVPFAQTIVSLEDARRHMGTLDPAKAAGVLDALGKQVEAQRRALDSSLKSGPVNKTVANRAAAEVQSLRATLRRWFEFYNGYDPLFTWWAEASFKSTDTALQSYSAFLFERVAGVPVTTVAAVAADVAALNATGRGNAGLSGPRNGASPFAGPAVTLKAGDTADIIGDPIGRDGLMSELAYEMIPYTPEELIAIANQEFAWCEGEMKLASRDLGYGDDWKKALEHVKNLYVEPGKQPALIRDLANEAVAFLDKHDLITIPPLARETWRMEMMSPERQFVNPFFTGGEVISVSYPVAAMSYEQKMMGMRGNNIHFSRATVFHELIPGHHLQGFIAARYKPYRALFGTPFLGEGWSLYWELLLWDLNFARGPEDRIGMLFWHMHRCARIIFSLSFHLRKMTPQQCVDFLVDRVGHERENAIGEVRRSFNGTYGPLYQAAYLLGGMQLHALHKELVDSGKMTNRAFHDAVLRENRIPVEMIRASLTGQKLSRDFVTSWKFYGPVTVGN
ncbi:MAG: DUF885 family protein [Bryobacteraceae bacterium]